MLNVPVAWFRAEDYEHIRQISGRGMPPTFTEWEAQMMRMLARSAAAGIVGEKVIVHPDELLAYARRFHAGNINHQVRSQFATLKFLDGQPGTGVAGSAREQRELDPPAVCLTTVVRRQTAGR